MTRNEHNEFRYIRSYKTRGFGLGHGTTLRVPLSGSADYKQRLHSLYTEWGFHPAAVKKDNDLPYYDYPCIVYIYGTTWKDNDGNERSWKELYTAQEKAGFESALL